MEKPLKFSDNYVKEKVCQSGVRSKIANSMLAG